jgi:hypothetical protein
MAQTWEAYLVRASLFRFSRSWPIWAPLSLLFISPSDWRVAKTASLAWGWCQYQASAALHCIALAATSRTPLPDMLAARTVGGGVCVYGAETGCRRWQYSGDGDGVSALRCLETWSQSVKPAERDAAAPGSYLRRRPCSTAPANSVKRVPRRPQR